MTNHIHAGLMAQYAQDARGTDKPWEQWEYKNQSMEQWDSLVENPIWAPDCEYRRKSILTKEPVIMCRLAGVKFPIPEQKILKKGAGYWATNASDPGYPDFFTWGDDEAMDARLLALNLIHLTRYNAVQHGLAIEAANRISVKQAKGKHRNDSTNTEKRVA